MKKFVVLLTLIAVFAFSMVSASAATTDDLIKALEAIPAANNKEFHDGAVKMIKEANFTSDQIDKLIPILEDLKTAVPTNKGPAARNYTKAEVDKVFEALDKACAITKYSYKVTDYKTSTGGSDFGIKVYAPDKSVALEYTDGIVKATGVEDTTTGYEYLYLAGGAVVIALIAAVIVMRKRVNG